MANVERKQQLSKWTDRAIVTSLQKRLRLTIAYVIRDAILQKKNEYF